ncbi:MAG: hypothetical protein Q9208_005666 [Pyrenodesmia sp. 3 TL-2023]
MAITHLVLFEFKPSLSQQDIESVCHRMLDLQNQCLKNGEKYIVSAKGGKNCSVEVLKASFTHGFVVEFANDEDRMYYIKEDLAHLSFVDDLKEVITAAGVVDFVAGEF